MVTQKEIFKTQETQEQYRKDVQRVARELIYDGTTQKQYRLMLVNCEEYELKYGSKSNRMLMAAINYVMTTHPTMFNANHPLNK
jgi:hypothetical protein